MAKSSVVNLQMVQPHNGKVAHIEDYPYNPFIPYQPQGAALRMQFLRDRELLISGPAGTGKTVACLQKMNHAALYWPGMRGLIVRKTRKSLTESGLYTLEEFVLGPHNPIVMGPRRTHRSFYQYPNGSTIVVGGMDNPGRIMSTEFDLIYVQEAIELSITDWESLVTRLRHWVMPYQQLLADTNPSFPTHWLKRRADERGMAYLESRHEDNPRLYNSLTGEWTDEGRVYIFEALESLTGPRKQRLRFGLWVQAEGIVYEGYDPALHIIPAKQFDRRIIKRYIAAQDWGFSNPGVLLIIGLDGDDRMYIVKQVYQTKRTIDWWVARASELTEEFNLDCVICDPSEPGNIISYQAAGIPAYPGDNSISKGVQRVAERLRKKADGRPRLYVIEDSLEEVDHDLVAKGLPFQIEGEFGSYAWESGEDKPTQKEKPADAFNHALDALRYVVMFEDDDLGWAA